MMAKAQDLQAQLDGKRSELAEVKRQAAAETQAAITAGNELKTVLDEGAAIAAVARQTVSTNKARVLGEQAAQLEADVAELKRQIAEERIKTLGATWEAARLALIEEAWAFREKLEAAEQADTTLRDAKAKRDGTSHGGSPLTSQKRLLYDFMVQIGAAELTYEGPYNTVLSVKRIGSQAQPLAKQNGNGITAKVAALAAAVVK